MMARHGTMTGDATEPALNGDLLTVACSCGVVFARWVTPQEADADLLRLAEFDKILKGAKPGVCRSSRPQPRSLNLSST